MTPLEAAALLAFGNPNQAERGLHHLEVAISNGADVNEVEIGATALCVLNTADRKEMRERHTNDGMLKIADFIEKAINLLTLAGADPWKGDPNVWEIEKPWGSIAVMRARAQSCHQLYGPDGGNDLHYVLNQPNHLYLYNDENIKDTIHKDWVCQLNQRGQSPLHVLWDRPLTVGSSEENTDRIEITRLLLNLGATIDQPDQKGTTVASLIAGQDKLFDKIEEVPEWEAILRKAQSIMQRQGIDASTRAVSNEALPFKSRL